MGSSVNVHWKDGPTTDQVHDALAHLEGKSYDGSDEVTKFKPTKYVKDDGTTEERQHTAWIQLSRSFSRSFLQRVVDKVTSRYGIEAPPIEGDENSAYVDQFKGEPLPGRREPVGETIMHTAYGTSEEALKGGKMSAKVFNVQAAEGAIMSADDFHRELKRALGQLDETSSNLVLRDNIIMEGDRIYVPQTANKAVQDWASKRGVVVRFAKGMDQQGSEVHMNQQAQKQFVTDFTPDV